MAYRPSILRRHPCVNFERGKKRYIRSPLPELIVERITSGLFYDVIEYDGSGDDFGKRFEVYCLKYLQEMIKGMDWKPEFKYGRKGFKKPSPDVLGFEDEKIKFIFECKARRMSYEAKFQSGPTENEGLKDIGKGVRQIWTFCADAREGKTGHTLQDNVIGAVLTMDNWGTMGMAYLGEIFNEAERQINEMRLDIRSEDRCPVLIVPVTTLERMAATASDESFCEAFELAQTDEFEGWLLDQVHSRTSSFDRTKKPRYPFVENIGELLPWWTKMGRGSEDPEPEGLEGT